jgi:hypothetical protein
MNKTFTLEQAGFRITNMVVKLYGSKKDYKREGEILSELLLEAGVEVGTKLNCLAKSTLDEDKHKMGKEVLVELAKVEHLVNVMEADKIYSHKKTKELLDYIESIRGAMNELNGILAEKFEKKSRKSVVVNMPQNAKLGSTVLQQHPAATAYAYPYDVYGFDEPADDD